MTTHTRTATFQQSLAHMERAREIIPRGVTSAKRAGRHPTPIAFREADGSRLIDLDGNEFIDYVGAFGPILLGHRPARVLAAVAKELERGVLYGGQHPGELELAERLVEMVPSAEMVLLSSSGSEAAYAAVRIARATTGRTMVIKFDGHYHGWLEPLAANQPGTTPGVGRPPRPVIAPARARTPDNVLICSWNDGPALAELIGRYGRDVAAVIMEPVATNPGMLLADTDYLPSVRELCDRHGIALIFDEVVTGFRLAPGGAQEYLGVTPDITVLGKAMGSGFPISAVVGTREWMEVAATSLLHVGTYNGCVPSVAAANATLALLTDDTALHRRLDSRAASLEEGLREAAAEVEAPLQVARVGSIVKVLWGPPGWPRTYSDVQRHDPAAVAALADALLTRGIYSLQQGTWYVSAAHTDEDIAKTVTAAEGALETLSSGI